MHSARTGSLENPEVLENVPGHVIPILEREFDDFDTESTRFLAGELEGDEFIKFRLKQGVYGQRQADVQMVRVKLPFGGVTPEQLEAFADVIDKYVPLRKGHITTRQNIQMHHIPLPDAAELIRELGDANLSSREGCGNTMRNVTGDPRAGTLEGEQFDITPYAGAYVRYFVRHPTTQAMPRKVKTAFAATDEDNAITRIHDIAFIPKVNEQGVKGVEMRVGGGTSIMPRLAPTLYEFVELDNGDYLKITEACMRIFDRQEWLRVNRARARIKVLIDKIGIDEFRGLVEEELQGDWVQRARLLPGQDRVRVRRRGKCAGPAARVRHAQWRQPGVHALRADQRSASAPARILDRRGQGDPRRSDPRAASRDREHHARIHRQRGAHQRASEPDPALGPRRVGLRRVAGARRAGA